MTVMANHTVAPPAAVGHLGRLESLRPVQAKADLKNLEMARRARIGAVVERALKHANLSQKQVADLVDRDVAQVQRWCSGAERPQFDALASVDGLEPWIVIAFAEVFGFAVSHAIRIDDRRVS